jgi:predicted nucleic acid-binding protein
VRSPTELSKRRSRRLVSAAASIALALDRAIYNCFYLALAVVEGMRLVTADLRFLAKLPATPWQDHAVRLGQA